MGSRNGRCHIPKECRTRPPKSLKSDDVDRKIGVGVLWAFVYMFQISILHLDALRGADIYRYVESEILYSIPIAWVETRQPIPHHENSGSSALISDPKR